MQTKKCPFCAEDIQIEAIKCKHCGEMLGARPGLNRDSGAAALAPTKTIERGLDFPSAIRSCFSQYASFQGRAPRSEFWFFMLFTTLGNLVCSLLDVALLDYSFEQYGPLYMIFAIATFLPSISVTVRRLHDVNRSGWWWWISLTIIGLLLLLYWFVKKSDDGANDYGKNPLVNLPQGGATARL